MLPLDAQLLHAVLERRGLDGQNARRPIAAADAPSCLFEHIDDMAAFDFLERLRWLQHRGGLRAVRQRHVKRGPVRQNHRALDHIAQFTNVARP